MFVGFIGLTGLLYVKKESLIPYLVAGCLGVLLFLPHIGVTLHHLNIDGGLQWLGKPDKTWLFQFTFHALNESWILTSVLIVTTSFVIYKSQFKSVNFSRVTIIFALWFFGIFVIGYLFSYFSSPILKFPVMLFPLPFLLLVIGNFFSKSSTKLLSLSFGILLLIGTSSTIVENQLYGNKHFGVFKELAEPIVKWRRDFGKENISTYFNLSNPNYLNYYIKKLDDSLEFNQHLIEFHDDIKIREELKSITSDYLIIGYSQRLTLPQVFETCKEFYPVIVDHITLNNCAVFLLAKKGKSKQPFQVNLLTELTSETKNIGNWKLNPKKLSGLYYLSDSTNIYGPDFIFKKTEIDVDYNYYLRIKVNALTTIKSELTVTLTAKRGGEDVMNNSGKKIWIGKNLETILYSSETNSANFSISIPKEIRNSDDIQISFWNRNGSPVKIQSISIETIENIWN